MEDPLSCRHSPLRALGQSQYSPSRTAPRRDRLTCQIRAARVLEVRPNSGIGRNRWGTKALRAPLRQERRRVEAKIAPRVGHQAGFLPTTSADRDFSAAL